MDYITYKGENLKEVIEFIQKKSGQNVVCDDKKKHLDLVVLNLNELPLLILNGDVIFKKKGKIKVMSSTKFTKKYFTKNVIIH